MPDPAVRDDSLRGGFLRSCAALPDRPALHVDDRTYTYRELDRVVRAWLALAQGKSPSPLRRIGVFGSRSLISYAGALVAACAGATYVPLNARFPAARTRSMIEHADLDLILVDDLGATRLAEVMAGATCSPQLLLPDELAAAAAAGGGATYGAALAAIDQRANAYLLFTSGSTGKPKGVPITHANVRAYIDWAIGRYGFGPDDRFSQTFEQTFDLSIFDTFVAWEAGACVYAMSPVELLSPARYINRHALTTWFSVPSVPAQMRRRNSLRPGTLPTLRWSLFCGEPLPMQSAEAWQAAAPGSTLENLYGPTELTISCTVYRWDAATSPALCINGSVPIGLPHPGLRAVLLDESLREVPTGEAGELCISGAQTSPGYWNDPERTAERFVTLDTGDGPAVYYRTGDRAQRLPGGDFTCLGRTDHQVKVLGFRIELGEIEAVILRVPGIVQAVAVPWPLLDGVPQGLVAFVNQSQSTETALRDACRAALPDYMVPAKFVPVAEMPLNSNGKVDRGALALTLGS